MRVIIKSHDFISTDEDPGLRIESFAIIKLRGVTTKLNIISCIKPVGFIKLHQVCEHETCCNLIFMLIKQLTSSLHVVCNL